MVAEALTSGVPVAEIARRHDMTPQHLFNWIRAAKEGRLVLPADEGAAFVPVVTTATEIRKSSTAAASTPIEIGIKDFVVRVGSGVDMGPADRRAARREGRDMIAVPAGMRVLVATKPVDFRRGADSLAALVREQLQHDPFSGTLFIFRSKRADRLKILVWDGSGLVLFWKRLEHGAFRWPPISNGMMRLSASQLAVLVDGMDWSRMQACDVARPTATS